MAGCKAPVRSGIVDRTPRNEPESLQDAEGRLCPLCAAPGAVLRWQLGDRLFGTTRDRFTLYRCVDCDLTFLWPVPDASRLASYYPSGYWAGPPSGRGSILHGRVTESYRRIMLHDHVRFVRQALEGQRSLGKAEVTLLDVGCGDGLFLDVLGHAPCAGLDLSESAVAACRARGLEARCGSLGSRPFADQQFDLVTMFHFLEHVSPAAPTLEHLRGLLRPGGEVIVQVPNAASLQARVLGRYWAGYDVPRHLMNYTGRSLCAGLERHGFEVIQVSHHSIRDNPTTLANSLAPWLYPPVRVARQRTGSRWQAWGADIAYLVLTSVLLPVTWVEGACGFGAAVMVRARPSG